VRERVMMPEIFRYCVSETRESDFPQKNKNDD